MTKTKIHRHIEGPFEDDNDVWYNLCLVEYPDGDIETAEIYFESFDAALEARDILTTSLYILEADVDVCSTMNLN